MEEALVVFREVSERNTSTLSTVLRRGQATGIRARTGVSVLAAGETGVVTRLFKHLGVAATDLNESQLATLRQRDDVAVVVENQVRYLPPVRRSTEAAAPPTEPRSPTVAYLQGIRDAANLAIAYHEGREFAISRPTVGIEAIGPMASRSTWGLGAIGVAPHFSGPTGRGVKVAVLDTGIDLNHPDLSSKVIEGVSAVSLVSGITVQDVNGHGTHCAGTICGPRESTSGVRYGVAPDIELLVGKVFNNRPRPSATDDDILEGITWADENGARIISMSLGSERDVGEAFAPLYEHLARQLLDRQQNSVLIVAAAGNESERPIFTAPVGNPAACPAIMAVAAIDRRGRIAPFSCRQMDNIGVVDVSAPGVGVFSSIAGGGFELLDGTSMATPHVAGMAALYLEREPNFTAQQLFDQLKLRARRLGDPADFGDGLIRL